MESLWKNWPIVEVSYPDLIYMTQSNNFLFYNFITDKYILTVHFLLDFYKIKQPFLAFYLSRDFSKICKKFRREVSLTPKQNFRYVDF